MTDENSADNGITPEERQLIEELSSKAKAESTQKRYASAMEKFYDWLKGRKESDELPISLELVQVYLSELSKELSKSTLNIVVSAIRHAHQTAGFDSPTDGQGVKELMQGISRQKKGDPETQAPAMTREVLENIKKTACNRRPRGRGKGRETESTARERGLTDIALCCTLFDGMMRINEALDLCRSDIRYDPDGRSGTAVIRVRRRTRRAEAPFSGCLWTLWLHSKPSGLPTHNRRTRYSGCPIRRRSGASGMQDLRRG